MTDRRLIQSLLLLPSRLLPLLSLLLPGDCGRGRVSFCRIFAAATVLRMIKHYAIISTTSLTHWATHKHKLKSVLQFFG